MGVIREWLFPQPAEVDTKEDITLDELLERYDLVDVDQRGSIIAAEPETGTQAVTKGEISGSGATRYRMAIQTDYNPLLSGQAAITKYQEMRNDSVTRSSLKTAKTPILSARWFMEPASQESLDVEISNFVWKNLTQWMTSSWPQFLIEVLYMLDYGVYAFEKVFDEKVVNGQRRIVWRKFAPRPPYEIQEFVYDDEGGPEAIKVLTNEGDVDLEIWKALIFTYDKEAGNLWGHSLLRSAYKHWFYKENLYKIDAIQKERHGIGIPVIILPVNYSEPDKTEAGVMAANLRTNERAHVVLPPGWEVRFLKLEGNRVDALESAQHHSMKLYENVLANFMLSTSGSNTTSGNTEQNQVFVRSSRFTAEIVRDVLNQYAIPQLVDYNWDVENYPVLRVRRLGDERDWRVLSFALRNLVGAHIIEVDEPMEAWARDELDMPLKDPNTIRQAPTPQSNPPQVGPPRQSRAENQRTEPGEAGRDSSGTSGTRS